MVYYRKLNLILQVSAVLGKNSLKSTKPTAAYFYKLQITTSMAELMEAKNSSTLENWFGYTNYKSDINGIELNPKPLSTLVRITTR